MYAPARLNERLDSSHGCAMGGIIAFTCGINGALPLVHGTTGCAGGYRMIMLLCDREPLLPTTAVYQYELVMGTRDKFQAALYKAKRIYDPDIIVVVLTCATSMAGENYSDIVFQFEQETGCKVFVQDGSALAGEDIDGYISMYNAFQKWLNVVHNPNGKTVALDGFSPTIYNAKVLWGQMEDIILDCGLNLAPSLSIDFNPKLNLEEYRNASVAKVGLLWNQDASRITAPIGIDGTVQFAKKICEMVGKDIPKQFVSKTSYIKEIARAQENQLRKITEGEWAMVEADGFFSIPLAHFLKTNLGMKIAVSTDMFGYESLTSLGICDWLRADMGGYELNEERKRMNCIVAFGSSNLYAHDDKECLYIPFTAPVWDEVQHKEGYFGLNGTLALLTRLQEGLGWKE